MISDSVNFQVRKKRQINSDLNYMDWKNVVRFYKLLFKILYHIPDKKLRLLQIQTKIKFIFIFYYFIDLFILNSILNTIIYLYKFLRNI